MRFRHLVRSFAAGAVLAAGSITIAPALAQSPGTAPPGPDIRPEWQGDPVGAPPAVDPRLREEWIAECRRRISPRNRRRGGNECASYFDSYYDYYAAHHLAYTRSYAPAPQYVRPTGACCQQNASDCTETVEYVDEPVPAPPRARRMIPRRAPDKRIRVD